MFLKICANTNLDDALLAAELDVDAVGFVFAPSKRQVTAEQVAAITCKLRDGVERVGVFAGAEASEIARCVKQAGLTAAQLHGEFDGDLVRELTAEFGAGLKIIQTVAYAVDAVDGAMADAPFEERLREVVGEAGVWAVLVDAAKSGVSGGLGVALDWADVGGVVRRAVQGREVTPRVILAGGLRGENVAAAIAAMRPWGVDVASGVEASAGKKDAAQLRAFVKRARDAAAGLQVER
ncbi:MAG: phosphoribosylanthranilate isomerase [Acidobacteria bacterium]|nr:phosphoribosylanthranilate isomerase [Acidobacteriota bacterium]